jgi:predicted nucleic acid-binding protein
MSWHCLTFCPLGGVHSIETPNDLEAVLDAMAEDLLLPSDALIVASCRHHKIKCIATFDSDFKRVKNFEILGIDSL